MEAPVTLSTKTLGTRDAPPECHHGSIRSRLGPRRRHRLPSGPFPVSLNASLRCSALENHIENPPSGSPAPPMVSEDPPSGGTISAPPIERHAISQLKYRTFLRIFAERGASRSCDELSVPSGNGRRRRGRGIRRISPTRGNADVRMNGGRPARKSASIASRRPAPWVSRTAKHNALNSVSARQVSPVLSTPPVRSPKCIGPRGSRWYAVTRISPLTPVPVRPAVSCEQGSVPPNP